jgi:lysylphosphatidylglycerol synthetase-like protein (DUF2156 family)
MLWRKRGRFDRLRSRQQAAGQRLSSSPRRSAGERAAALTLAVVLDAVAFATVLRPGHGYAPDRLVIALAAGVGAALAVLILAGGAVAARGRSRRSLWAATTSPRTLSVVLALFVAVAAGWQLARAPRASPSQTSNLAARRDFQRWQQTVSIDHSARFATSPTRSPRTGPGCRSGRSCDG